MSRLQLGANGPSIAYDLIGSGTPPIVFVHGGTYNRRMWTPVIEKLSGSYECLNIDLPGHGESSDAESYDLKFVAGMIHELVEKLGLVRPIMVGHSLGAAIVGIYVSMYPTSGLVTSDQQIRITEFHKRIQAMREQLQSPAFPQIWRAIERQLRIDLIPEERRGLVQGKNSNPRQDVLLGYWKDLLTVPPAETEKQINESSRLIPSSYLFTAIFGENIDPDYRSWLDATIPQCDVVVFPNAGHFPHLVDPDRFATEVRSLARRATSPTNPVRFEHKNAAYHFFAGGDF